MKNKIPHIICLLVLTSMLNYTANAQVIAQKIGTNPTNLTPSAVLDIESSNKGVLFPRVALSSTTDVTTIVSPATGLTVFNTATAGTTPNNVSPGYYYWKDSKWTKVATDAEASKWTYDAINSRVNLAYLSNGTTARTGAKSFGVHDNNILQIGDMTDVAGASVTDKSIVTRINGDNATLNISDGGVYSAVGNEIYGGSVLGSAAYFTMTKHRGSLVSPAIVQNGDLIGILDFRAGTGVGANFVNGARLITSVDGAVNTSLSPLTVPMSFDFRTSSPVVAGATTGNAATSKLMIKSNGNIGVGTTTPLGRLIVNDDAYVSALPTSTSNLLDNTAFRPHTRLQTTAGAFNNALSTYMTGFLSGANPSGVIAQQAHNYSTGTPLSYVLQPAGGNVGINTSNPVSTLSNTSSVIQGTNIIGAYSGGLNWSSAGTGFAGAFYSQPTNGNGLLVKIAGNASTNNAFEVATGTQTGTATPLFNVKGDGNVGVGTSIPTSKLEVNGAATNTAAFNAGSSTTIDFSKSNLAYTSASPGGTFTLSNIKDGGTYTLAVRGTTAGTASFTATGFTFKSPNNGLTAAGKETLYSFIVIGTSVYFYMTTGL